MCWRKITFLTVTTDEDFLIDGAKIFEGADTGKTCTVFDPKYGERHKADIYEVQGKTKKFKVAIAEFSMCVYGIYLVGDGIKEKTERSPRQKPTALQKVGWLAIVSSILTLIAVMIACALKSDYFMLLPVPFFLVFVVSVGFFLKMLYKNNRKRYFAKELNETKVDYRSNGIRPYYDVEEEFDNVIAKNNWETVQKVLSDNGIPIDVYTLNAYIETFGDTDFFGDKDINQIDEWLTKNVDAFEENLKNAVVDFFVEEHGFSWLKTYCNDAQEREFGLKKIRFATIRNILDSLSDDSLNYYVEIFDGFGPLDEILDMPASLYGTIEREGISKAYQVIKNWVETEKEDILKGLGKKEDISNYKFIFNALTNNLKFADAIAADPYILKEDATSYCPKCKRMSFGLNWYPPYKIEVYKRNIGDIVLGTNSMIVTKKFKDVYEQNGLTGIREFCRIESVKWKGNEIDSELYYVKLNRYDVPIDYEKSKMEGDRAEWQCDLCNPNGKYNVYINGLFFQKDFPADIFHIYSCGSVIFLSGKFVSAMERNGITNLENNYMLCDEYIKPTWPKEFYEKAKALRATKGN